jgi:hypothetical protein
MQTSTSYLARAEDCQRKANEAQLPPDQARWESLAWAWLKLAEAERVQTASPPHIES